jgi:predicted nucleic acid-binding protein
MIVVDTNILVALEIETDGSENARKVAALDPDWRLPFLWRVEFSNVLRNLHRVGKIGPDEAGALFHVALERYRAAETLVDDETALALAIGSGLTSYDACYLGLARQLGIVLVTEDRELVKKSGGGAETMASWLSRKAGQSPSGRQG